jgi:exopolysaccharide biosynthesis polyprenyl glycosylphosphotransferase
VTAQAVAIGFGALTVVALKVPTSSRVVMFTFALTATAGLVAYRSAFWLHQRRKFRSGAYAKNILIIGHPSAARRIAQHFGRYTHAHEFRLAGWLNTGEPGVGGARLHQQDTPAAARVEPLGHVADLADLLVHHPVHEVIAVESGPGQTWIADVIEHCDYYRVRLRIVPEGLLAGGLDETPLVFRGDRLGLPQIVISPPLLDAEVLFVKRVMDIVLSALLLVVLAPVLLLVALAIKITTPHLPVLYRWRVIGLNGRPFTGYKFTTMVADADEQKAALLPRNEMQGPVFKLTNDPRITPLGRLLRKFSLNELPQLWSVLIGDMSLVGPRPAFRHELERYERWHKRKLCVKPGITCLWQVSGRNRITDFDEWVRLDLQYIDEWSLWLDLRILGRTLWAVVSGSGS